MGVKLLHISDIHFRTYDGRDFQDLDKDIQNEILLDLKFLKEEYRTIDILLIGGDIAFAGKRDEYEMADKWIKVVCSIIGCKDENVFTVPGNHDVDRGKISVTVRDIQRTIKSLKGDRAAIDKKIQEYILSPPDAEILLKPFENYNAFASKYGSVPTPSNVLFWEKDIALDGKVLRIRGVNSALVSSDSDHEVNSQLILGTHQGLMERDPGKINLILCHHPPSWLGDGDAAKKDFKARAKLHLFGHKHVFDVEIIENSCLVLSAGAMQPERHIAGWEPRYNIIDLSIKGSEKEEVLVIQLYKRVWDRDKKKFTADRCNCDGNSQRFEISLVEFDKQASVFPTKIDENAQKQKALMDDQVIDLNNPNPFRKLAYLFLGLPYHKRLSIAVELGLVKDEDDELTDLVKAQEYLKRAVENDRLAILWDKVMQQTGETLNNPFK